GRVVCERGDAVEHRALEVGERPDGAVARIERAHVLDDTRVAKRTVEISRRFVVVGARHGPDRLWDERAERGNGEFPQLAEIRPLEIVLEGDPSAPRFI